MRGLSFLQRLVHLLLLCACGPTWSASPQPEWTRGAGRVFHHAVAPALDAIGQVGLGDVLRELRTVDGASG